MKPTSYAVIWFDRGSIFTLVDSQQKTVILNDPEAHDLAEIVSSRSAAKRVRELNDPSHRFAVDVDQLQELFGVSAS